jgi:hypothetical protein
MTWEPDCEAVLVTGVYGAGKSTVVADMAALLDSYGARYGALDVDWLGWFNVGDDDATHRRVLLSNLAAVCAAYLDEGVRYLALAFSVKDRTELDAIRGAVGVPLRVVRLEVDVSLVTRRLAVDPTEARRRDDLRVASEWLAAGHGVGFEELVLRGDQPVRQTSETICSWLGWT